MVVFLPSLPAPNVYVDIDIDAHSNFLGVCGAAGRFGKEGTFPKNN